MDDIIGGVILFLIGVFVFMGGLAMGWGAMEKKAYDKGHAIYVIDPEDPSGDTVFKWKVCKGANNETKSTASN